MRRQKTNFSLLNTGGGRRRRRGRLACQPFYRWAGWPAPAILWMGGLGIGRDDIPAAVKIYLSGESPLAVIGFLIADWVGVGQLPLIFEAPVLGVHLACPDVPPVIIFPRVAVIHLHAQRSVVKIFLAGHKPAELIIRLLHQDAVLIKDLHRAVPLPVRVDFGPVGLVCFIDEFHLAVRSEE